MAKAKAKPKTKTKPKKETVEEPVDPSPQPAAADLEETTPAEKAREVAKEETERVVGEKEEKLKEEAEEEAEEVKEQAPPEEAPEEEEGLEIVEEKFYDLNLRRIWNSPREKRTPRAVRFLREFVARRMKTDDVSLSNETNSMLWVRGISKPPRKIRVRVVKDKDGRVIVFPAERKLSSARHTV